MFPDYFYNYLSTDTPWIVIAIGYAVFDYTYNLFMCILLGGIINTWKHNGKTKKQTTLNSFKIRFLRFFNKFKNGGQELLSEFFNDKLSWSWPITSLTIPTFIYGISRMLASDGISSLEKSGINTIQYFLFPNNDKVQIFFWSIALLLSLRTFYRYQKERSKPTWFSRIWIFSFSRILLFNLPLAYMVQSTLYVWLQYSTTIFQILSSDQIQYIILHPDLMYGLEKIYDTVIVMGVSLIVLSLLPSLMLIREKEQRYNRMYYLLVYGGVISLFILLSSLILKFDQRLGEIQETALSVVQTRISVNTQLSTEEIAGLEYFALVSNLPGHFPIPAWFNFLLSARSIALLFEVIKIVSPSSPNSNFFQLLQKIFEK